MNRVDFQNKISELLDRALNDLNVEEFEIFIERVKRMIEDYK